MATTATANDRVIADIKEQLGQDLVVVRGNLMRKNLAIQINPSQSQYQRTAWLIYNLRYHSTLSRSQGLIYCLTTKDCDRVAGCLKSFGIQAEAYHSKLKGEIAAQNLADFESGHIRVLVATTKLGMGYDKSDIRFIVHYQIPDNLISYYQQIGRAGRDGKLSYVILQHGIEDEEILDFFIKKQTNSLSLLKKILEEVRSGPTYNQLLDRINETPSRIKQALKYLKVNEYLTEDSSIKPHRYFINPQIELNEKEEKSKQEKLNASRINERDRMKAFLTIQDCFMYYIAKELDAPDLETKCNQCMNCNGYPLIPLDVPADLENDVKIYFEHLSGIIQPRQKSSSLKLIPKKYQMQPGWVLEEDYYSLFGQLVKKNKYTDNRFGRKIVADSVRFLEKKTRDLFIDCIAAVPSLNRPDLVPNFARNLGYFLHYPFANVLVKTRNDSVQKELNNSVWQEKNIDDTVMVINKEQIIGKTILLVDDMTDSGWTFTVIARKLLESGAKAVYPFALVKTGNGGD